MTDQHPDDDRLLALALDDTDDSEREAALDHLATCHRCRGTYDAFAVAVEHTFAASPNVEPPPGFEGRALAAMGLSQPFAEQPRRRLQRWQLVAASVVVGLGLGAGGAVTLAQVNDSDRVVLAEQTSYLETGEGQRVGTVTRSFVDGEPALVVTVTTGEVGMEYRCVLRLESGKEVTPASWVLESDHGETWVVPSPEAPVTALVLVANGGAGPVWSEATL